MLSDTIEHMRDASPFSNIASLFLTCFSTQGTSVLILLQFNSYTESFQRAYNKFFNMLLKILAPVLNCSQLAFDSSFMAAAGFWRFLRSKR